MNLGLAVTKIMKSLITQSSAQILKSLRSKLGVEAESFGLNIDWRKVGDGVATSH